MKNCVDHLPADHVAIVMDYAESYTCRFQNETQSAFFDPQQVVLHPMMLYYQTTSNDPDEPGPMIAKHAIVGVTDDNKKDHVGVAAFEEKALKMIKEKIPHIKYIHRWSDGCAAQYKGKGSFSLLARHNHKVCHNYFESSHGKSVCDGLGATTKNICARAVLTGRAVIANAEDLYIFCQSNYQYRDKILCRHGSKYISSREYVFVSSTEVDRSESSAKPIKGTRLLHAVRNTGNESQLQVRQLSCYCDGCYSMYNDIPCQNSAYVDMWKAAYPEEKRQTTGILSPKITMFCRITISF